MQCPEELEENEPLSSSHVTSTAVPGGLLVDTNLDTSSPDTFRTPPAPLPYDIGLGGSQTPPRKTDLVQSSESRTDERSPCENLKGLECINKNDNLNNSPKVEDDEISKLKGTLSPVTDEEDVCPICLEGIDFSHQVNYMFLLTLALKKIF